MRRYNWVCIFFFFAVASLTPLTIATVYESFEIYLQVNIQSSSQPVTITVDVIRPKNVSLSSGSDNLDWVAYCKIGNANPYAIASAHDAVTKQQFNFVYHPTGTVDYSLITIDIEANWNRWGHNQDPLALQHYYVHLIPYYYVKISSSYGQVTGSGFYKVGSEIYPSLNTSEISFNNGTKLVLTGWKITDGFGNSFTIAPKGSFIVKQVTDAEAIWKKYFLVRYHDLFNNSQTWKEANSHVTISAKNEVYSSQDIRYTFVKFIIGNSSSGISQNPYTFVLSSPVYLEGEYKKEFKVSITSLFGTITGSTSGWYEEGALVNCSVFPKLINVSAEERLRFLKWSIAIPTYVHSPLQINATWIKEVFVQVNKYDNSSHIVYGWYPVNSMISFETPTVIDFGNKTSSVFVKWSDDETKNSRHLLLTQPLSIYEVRCTYYLLTFNPFYPVFKVSSTLSEQAQWVKKGALVEVSLSSNVYEVSKGKRYKFLHFEDPTFSNSSLISFIMNEPTVVKSAWLTEYYINFSSKFFSSKDSGWYPEGAKIFPSVESKIFENENTRWVFTGWSVQVPIIVSSSQEVFAIWKKQVYVEVVSEYSVTEGSGWYDEKSLVKLTTDKTKVILKNGTELIFNGWLVNGSFLTAQNEVTVSGPTTIKAMWKIASKDQALNSNTNSDHKGSYNGTKPSKSETYRKNGTSPLKFYEIVVVSNFSEPQGAGMYTEGTIATIYLVNYTFYISNSTRYIFSHWNIIGNNLPVENKSLVFNVHSNLTIVASWKKQVLINETWYDSDTPVLLHAPIFKDVTNSTRKRFVFWLLANGSKLLSSKVLLKAEDASGAKSIYTTENVLLFVLHDNNVQKVNVSLSSNDGLKVNMEVSNGTKLWFKNSTLLTLELCNDSLGKVVINGTRLNDLKLNMSYPNVVMFSTLVLKNGTSTYTSEPNEILPQNDVTQIALVLSIALNLYFILSRFLLPFYQRNFLKSKIQNKLLITKIIKKKY